MIKMIIKILLLGKYAENDTVILHSCNYRFGLLKNGLQCTNAYEEFQRIHLDGCPRDMQQLFGFAWASHTPAPPQKITESMLRLLKVP